MYGIQLIKYEYRRLYILNSIPCVVDFFHIPKSIGKTLPVDYRYSHRKSIILK